MGRPNSYSSEAAAPLAFMLLTLLAGCEDGVRVKVVLRTVDGGAPAGAEALPLPGREAPKSLAEP